MYQSPKSQQHEEGREERDRQVREILANMTPFTKEPVVRRRYNPVTQRVQEVR